MANRTYEDFEKRLDRELNKRRNPAPATMTNIPVMQKLNAIKRRRMIGTQGATKIPQG